MSLSINLPPELEREIRQAAEREGVGPETYALSALADCVSNTADSTPQQTEADLLEQISVGLPPTTWERYHALCAGRRADTLSGEDYAELLELTEQVELWNARRLELLVELSRMRGVPLRSLVEEMGLAPAPYA